MELNFFLPFRYNSETSRFEPEMYTNVTQNIYRDVLSGNTLEQCLADLEAYIENAQTTADEALASAGNNKAAIDDVNASLSEIVPEILLIQENEPDGNAKKLWINPGNSVMHYWNGSEWTPVVGIWG